MKRLTTLAAAILLLAAVSPARGQSAGELFQKAKSEVKLGSYADAMKTLAALDAETAKPGHEAERQQAEPVLNFYRGVCEASLGHKDEAKGYFVAYLGTNPNASIDSAVSPKAVARSRIAEVGAGGPPSHITASYASFRQTSPCRPKRPTRGQRPVRALIERREEDHSGHGSVRTGSSRSSGRARSEARDLENEFAEFERRVAYADLNPGHDEIRGSIDRGFRPPRSSDLRRPQAHSIGRGHLNPSECRRRHDGESAVNALAAAPSGKATWGRGGRPRPPTLRAPKAAETAANWREIWHYRRELLPAGVPYQQVDFDFITRKGYGKNVMQRDPMTLNTLEAARKGKKA